MSLKEVIDGYGVLLTNLDGKLYLAIDNRYGPGVCRKRKEAVALRKEYAEHGLKGKIVRVRATFEVVEKGKP